MEIHTFQFKNMWYEFRLNQSIIEVRYYNDGFWKPYYSFAPVTMDDIIRDYKSMGWTYIPPITSQTITPATNTPKSGTIYRFERDKEWVEYNIERTSLITVRGSQNNNWRISTKTSLMEIVDLYHNDGWSLVNTKIKSNKVQCTHEFKPYIGAFQTFEYCIHCDKKKG